MRAIPLLWTGLLLAVSSALAAVVSLATVAPSFAAPACTEANAHTLPGRWVMRADSTSSAGDYGLSGHKLQATLKQMDSYVALVRQALGTPQGYLGSAGKIVGWAPLFDGGPIGEEVDAAQTAWACRQGRAVDSELQDGAVAIEVNRLWSMTSNTSETLNGKPLFLLNYPLGELRGYPLTERPYEAAFGGDLHQLHWAVLVSYPGKLPFRYVSRREYIDFAKSYLEQQKAKDAAMWRQSLPVRPAAEQAAEKQRELERIRRNETGSHRDRLLARYLAEYKTDEQKRDGAIRKSAAAYDERLARLATVERMYTPAQLAEPAVLGSVSPVSINDHWNFSTDLKTDRTHVCTASCEHGQQLVTINQDYFDPSLPRSAPQLFVVVFNWEAKVRDHYRNPAAEQLRDRFFANFDFAALTRQLATRNGKLVSAPGPALQGPSSAGAGEPAPDHAREFRNAVAKADHLYAAGDYFEAVREYEAARRVAYNNHLDYDHADLEARLAKARAATEAPPQNKPAATTPPASSLPAAAPAASGPQQEYRESLAKADALYASGDYFEAVREYEAARRIAYNNHLDYDQADLEARLAKARAASEARRSSPPAATASPVPATSGPWQDYRESLAKADALYASGDYFEAVREYEAAKRVAYNNHLDNDKSDLEARLARARAARDAKKEN